MSKKLLDKQLELEKIMHQGGIERWNKKQQATIDKGNGDQTDWNVKLTKQFIEPVSKGIESFIDKYDAAKRKPDALYYIGSCDSKTAAFITIRALLKAAANTNGASLQHISKEIADRIEDQVRFSRLLKRDERTRHYLEKIQETLKKNHSQSYKHARGVHVGVDNKLSEAHGKDKWLAWDDDLKLKMGQLLVKIACEMLVIWDYDQPEPDHLFSIGEVRITKKKKGLVHKTVKVVEVNGAYLDYVSDFISRTEIAFPELTPCVVPPKDWVTPFKGGYHSKELQKRVPMIKMRDKELMRSMTRAQMPMVYRALNGLQRTPFMINTEILDIMQEVWKRNLGFATPLKYAKPKPVNPLESMSDYEFIKELRGKQLKKALTKKQYAKFEEWKSETKEWHDEDRKRKAHVLRLEGTLKIAETYSTYPSIYFVHTLDSRCRFYAKGTGLHPQGHDREKGLLRLARKKKLGANGHYWFKIHGANVWGWDKEHVNARVSNVESQEFQDMCRGIADNPIKNLGWLDADKPWQFMSWCFEYVDYLDFIAEGNKQEEFETFIAAALDGSCSGIQHYSAMLRDEVGGSAVNLIDSELPQDIYGRVAEVVLNKVDTKAEGWEGVFAQEWINIGIGRNLCKTPVMTLPYGSTMITCLDAVKDYLKSQQEKYDKECKAKGEKPKPITRIKGEMRHKLVDYISKRIWTSIGEVVIKAREGSECIRSIAKEMAERGLPIVLESYTGFMMKQEIYKTAYKSINTTLMGRITFKVSYDTNEMDVRAMQDGLPPNLIHLQDATHLVITN